MISGPFRAALQRGNDVAIIAEVKKASPSAGIIAADFNPLSQAREYARGGAHALSVLTDEKYFHGHLSLPAARSASRSSCRCCARTSSSTNCRSTRASSPAPTHPAHRRQPGRRDAACKLYDRAKACQLDVLVEVHDLAEMDRALELGADMIGINNRNLKTFEVDLATTEALAEEIPSDTVAISESGIKTARMSAASAPPASTPSSSAKR